MSKFQKGDRVRSEAQPDLGVGVVHGVYKKKPVVLYYVRFEDFEYGGYDPKWDTHTPREDELRHAVEARPRLPGEGGVEVTDLNEGVLRGLAFTVNPDGATDVNPSHYDFPGGVQVIDITKHLDFLSGNVVKYVSRAGRKGDRLTDLLKARKYLDWAIEKERLEDNN